MTRDEIKAKATTVVMDHLVVEADQVTEKAEFFNDLNADSLDSIELAMAIEETFDISISDDEASAANTFGALVDLIVSKVAVEA